MTGKASSISRSSPHRPETSFQRVQRFCEFAQSSQPLLSFGYVNVKQLIVRRARRAAQGERMQVVANHSCQSLRAAGPSAFASQADVFAQQARLGRPCHHQQAYRNLLLLVHQRPCGLMDKALVLGTKDCRLESCQGHDVTRDALRLTMQPLQEARTPDLEVNSLTL